MEISIRAYATRKGISDTAVRKAIKSGRITLTKNGKINPALADRQWEANTDPAQVYAIKEDSPARAASSETASSASSGGIGVSYQQSRAIREAYEARLKN